MSERYEIRESKRFFGKFVVVDTKTSKVYKFYNLKSARTFIKERKKIDDE